MVKGCERDTDHDGNCPLHPKGCPASTLSEYIAPRTPRPWEPSFSHSYPRIYALGQLVAEFEWNKDREAAVQAVNEAPALRARVAELEARLASSEAAAHVRADQFVRARVAASYWHPSDHTDTCYSQWPGDNKPNGGKCNCGSDDNNANRDELRRVLKLEEAE